MLNLLVMGWMRQVQQGGQALLPGDGVSLYYMFVTGFGVSKLMEAIRIEE